MESFCCICLP